MKQKCTNIILTPMLSYLMLTRLKENEENKHGLPKQGTINNCKTKYCNSGTY